jgi:general secretion pathway protein B
MSFILDALKKLEQKRQHGAVPDLMTIHAHERQRHEKRTLWPYLVLGALVLNAGILAAVLRPWEAENKKPIIQASVEQLQKKASQSPTQHIEKKNEPVSVSPQIKTSSHVPGNKPINTNVSSGPVKKAADLKKVVPLPKQGNPPAPVEQKIKGPLKVEKAPVTNKLDSDTGSPAALSMNPSRDEMEVLRNRIKEETSQAGSARPRKDTPVSNEKADSDTLPDFSQLPEETRKEIPNINISAHIYSNNPRSRIVNINGSTIKEGDEVTKGLKVSEITISGVIFDYQGRRFQVRAF